MIVLTEDTSPKRGEKAPGPLRGCIALYRGNFARTVRAYVPLAAISPLYLLLLRLTEGTLSTLFPGQVNIDEATYLGIIVGITVVGNLLLYLFTSLAAWRAVACLGGVPVPVLRGTDSWRRCLRALFSFTLLHLAMLLAGNLAQNGLGAAADALMWNVGILTNAFVLGATFVITVLSASARALVAALFALWLPNMALGGMRFFPALKASLRGTKGRLGQLLVVFIPFYVITGPLFDMLLSYLSANVFPQTQPLNIPLLLIQAVLYAAELFAAPVIYAAAVLKYPGKIVKAQPEGEAAAEPEAEA